MTEPATGPETEPATAPEADAAPSHEPVTATGIVVGADGSASSSTAVLWAADTAAAYGVALTVVHSRPDAAGEVVELSGGDSGDRDTVLDDAARVAAEHQPGVAVREVQFPEAPVQALLAASETAEVVVIGSRGLEGFAGLLVGSTTMHVVPYASCPVVVVRPAESGGGTTPSAPAESPEPPGDDATQGAVVLGYDGSVSANRAAAFAFRHAAATGTRVVVVTSRRGAPDQLTPVDPNDAIPGSDTASFHAPLLLVADAHPQVPVTFRAGGGHAAPTLLSASEGAALLVVGSRGRGGFAGLVLGSVSQKVLAHARCPVAFVPARVSAAVAGGL
jgi:nucleotide-binding universal stress UspA family protein